jgi:hypothetical protein
MRIVHLDERSPDMVGATEGKTPCILGRSSEGWEMVLDMAQLESYDQSVEAFESMLRARLEG